MSSTRSLLRRVSVLALLAAAPAGLAATSWAPVALTAEVLQGVGEYAITRSRAGRLSVVYCGQDCTTIYYRVLSEAGVWSAPEIVNTGTGPTTADLAIDLDPSGVPQVFWGRDDWSDDGVLQALRQSSGTWAQRFVVPGDDGTVFRYGRLNTVRIGAGGQLHLLTTTDYRVGGGYVFSDLDYLTGPVDGALVSGGVYLTGEYVWDLDLGLRPDGRPIFAVSQQYYGGQYASKLVYHDGSQWQERVLQEAWGLCVTPIQIAVGAAIHLNSCGRYARFSDTTAEANWVSSWRGDMTIDENDVPYFAAADAGSVTLGTIAADGSKVWLPVEAPPPACPGGVCPSFTKSRVLYDRGQVLVAYLGDDRGLRVKGYAIDALRCSFSGLAALTMNTVGSGAGTLSRVPAGSACGTDTWGYPAGTRVTLGAAAGADAVFRTWAGACADQVGACTLTLQAGDRKEVTAEFNWFPAALKLPRSWRQRLGH